MARELVTCKKCGGEGHLVCRPLVGILFCELYTVDCEDCDNTTNEQHANQDLAIEQWNTENSPPPPGN